jgi:chromosome segregation ATPase
MLKWFKFKKNLLSEIESLKVSNAKNKDRVDDLEHECDFLELKVRNRDKDIVRLKSKQAEDSALIAAITGREEDLVKEEGLLKDEIYILKSEQNEYAKEILKTELLKLCKAELEIKAYKQIIANQEDALKAIPEAIRSERELRVKLEDLQHKYDSKVARYKKIITKLESKRE